ADIQTAFLYDHFTPFVLEQLEELGFCGRGEARDFATIENLSIGGRLPINTSGGLLGEAYIHGMNGITEAVRQIRGTSGNQGPGGGAGPPPGGAGGPTRRALRGAGRRAPPRTGDPPSPPPGSPFMTPPGQPGGRGPEARRGAPPPPRRVPKPPRRSSRCWRRC